jgi:murein DD-endopeptidase MepM/ murein hydrolase activator NlpD
MFKYKGGGRPKVTSASKYIDTKSHKEKKYLSLMLVPSYSTGRTRTIRIPRTVFHSVVIGFLVISAVITGLYLRTRHFQDRYAQTEAILHDTVGAFHEHVAVSGQIQDTLLEAAAEALEAIGATETRERAERDYLERRHQNTLEGLWEQMNEFEELVRLFEEQRQGTIDGLSARVNIIPPAGNLFNQLTASQSNLLENSVLLNQYEDGELEVIPVMATATSIQFISFESPYEHVPFSEAELLERIAMLKAEIELQQQLVDDLAHYRNLIDPHLRNHPTLWPIQGRITSGFGGRMSPVGRGWENHNGVDIPARSGTPIRASGGGVVTFSAWKNGYGNTVILDHGFGISTLYAHNTSNRVRVGQRVERGDIIAYVGSTGWSTGPHLHYGVRVNNRYVNPVPFMVEHHR